MYAIFQAKGKQFRAEPEATLRIPKLDAEPGQTVHFDEVLLGEREGGEILVGRPALAGANVSAEVVRHGKGEKIVVFKMKRRKNYRRKQGHRQQFTEIRVVDITLGSGTPAAKKKAAEPAAKSESKAVKAPKAEKPKAKAAKEPEATPEVDVEPALEELEVDITGAAAELAKEHGIDVTRLEGTGKDGRILKGDVEKAIKEQQGD